MKIGLGIGVTQPQNAPLASMQNPSSLFLQGEQGAWYDPSDINLTWRRNLLTYSEQFDNAVWSKFASTTPSVSITNPIGGASANKLIADTTNNYHWAGEASTVTASTTYTYSFYAKAAEVTTCWFEANGAPSISGTYNLSTGAASGIGASMTGAGNGWYRCVLTFTTGAAVTSFQGRLGVGAFSSYVGDGTSGIYIWGAQLELGNTATPYQRITDGIKDYLDYKPLPVLYQDAAGTIPCTAVEQPVGLMLDKSKGLMLGSELVANGDFSQGTTGWSVSGAGATIAVTNGIATVANGSANEASLLLPALTAGKWYFLSADISAISGTVSIYFVPPSGSQISNIPKTAAGKLQGYFYSGTTGAGSRIAVGTANAGAYFSIDNISVRELPGNHAFNSSGNSANFPVLSARYNLLTKTEQFDDVVWAKAGINVSANAATAPDGTGTADLITSTAAAGYVYPSSSIFAAAGGATYKISIYAKAGNVSSFQLLVAAAATYSGTFNLATNTATTSTGNTTVSIVDVGNGWYYCTIICAAVANSAYTEIQFGRLASGNSIYIWGADLRVTNDALNQPAYQRVNTATDYDTAGFKPYLRFNGVNQWLQTNSIDFTYGDKMFVCAGVRKLSDVPYQTVCELSADLGTNNGSFTCSAPDTAGTYLFRSKGTFYATCTATGYSPPITNVFTGIGVISADTTILRINGSQASSSALDQGTGNYGNYPLYIGARAGTSLWFNGRLHGLLLRGAQTGITNIQLTERYMNTKTAAYLEAPSGSVDFLVTNAGDYLVTSEQDYLYAID